MNHRIEKAIADAEVKVEGNPRPRFQLSLAIIFWILTVIAIYLATLPAEFSGFVAATSLLLTILVFRTAPWCSWFERVQVVAISWGAAVLAWSVVGGAMGFRKLGSGWFRTDGGFVAAMGAWTLSIGLFSWLILGRRRRTSSWE